jgi:superfamily II DNA/RNA helicase
MNVFQLHKNIMSDYKAYIESFVTISNDRIKEKVKTELTEGKLWPEPLIQFNPSFRQGKTLKELTDEGLMHAELNNVFSGYSLYEHQVEALKMGSSGKDFIVVSGTGSGKSLTYISTIFDNLFKTGSWGQGVKAVIVYPMNALINSQYGEFEKYAERYKENTKQNFPIKIRKYTGQEKADEKKDTIDNPPDVLLTNYVMLELLLTRNSEERLRKNIFNHLKYLVFDELHTYRGRQGSDVAILIRKIQSQCDELPICIGTSATMASGSTWQQQQELIAQVANRFFAKPFSTEQVIGEYLDKVTNGTVTPQDVVNTLKNVQPFLSSTDLISNPLSIWLESNIILSLKGDRYFRAKPETIGNIVNRITDFTKLYKVECEEFFLRFLNELEIFNNQRALEKKKSFFPFKIHQFINQTGSVYATLEGLSIREVELDAVARTSPDKGAKPFYQIVFSRITGVDLYCVEYDKISNSYKSRIFNAYIDDEKLDDIGYLIIQDPTKDPFWNSSDDLEKLPENWIEYDKNGIPRVKKNYKQRLPQQTYVNEYGLQSDRPKNGFLEVWFIPYKSNIDFTSGTVYDSRTRENTMYSSLGVEGRSTSTNILVFSMIRQMNDIGLERAIQKVLSFTDNRQDTALQSGHFNDFIRVGQLRSAIWKSISINGNSDASDIVDKTFDQLRLNINDLARKPAEPGGYVYDQNVKMIKLALKYKIISDLKRGWRVILPNLEQCALLEINYKDLDRVIINSFWSDHPLLQALTIEYRRIFIFQILDAFRKSSAIDFIFLNPVELENNKQKLKEHLKTGWLFSEDEDLGYSVKIRIRKSNNAGKKRISISSAASGSTIGRFIKNFLVKTISVRLSSKTEYEDFVEQIFESLCQSGLLVKDVRSVDVPLYQLNGDVILWCKGNERELKPDMVKNPSYLSFTPGINAFFQIFYKTDFRGLKSIVSGEHSGQLNNEQRIIYEKDFSSGALSLLCCSPTMELGIDISDLMAVHMRNVPPDPANYAQRSGRAGRSGQAAIVFTYCSAYSAHDQHYFQNRIDMVAGVVQAPTLDFSNEDLLRSHLYSLFISEAGIDNLNESIRHLVEENPGPDFLKLSPLVIQKLTLAPAQLIQLKSTFNKLISDIRFMQGVSDWLTDQWIERTFDEVKQRFDNSLNRWRSIYKNAKSIIEKATLIEIDVTIPASDPIKKMARSDKFIAQKEIDLIRNSNPSRRNEQSEFYPYRYLAAEGFLPGFNFTRLPVRLYIPEGEGQYLSRPRSLAIREFGPRNSVYYMGSRFQVNRMPVNDLDNNLALAKISNATGYILSSKNGDYDANIDPFSQIDLSNDNNRELLMNLVELSECRAEESGRITCEEEERMREGFEIETYFSMKGNLSKVQRLRAIKHNETLIEIAFLPSVSLYKINRKWKAVDKQGFIMEEHSGAWKKPSAIETAVKEGRSTDSLKTLLIYTEYTADAIYLKPLNNLNLTDKTNSPITLLFALKRAIEKVFQVESREIGAEIMGNPEEPNIMIYEASEGSLGILKQLIQKPELFKSVAAEAYKICHFDLTDVEQQPYGTASYHDLLSYFNQQYHPIINRYDIKDALINMKDADYEFLPNSAFNSYEQQYHSLVSQIDPASSTELPFLKYLYDNKLRLPDKAQYGETLKECRTIPDFLYDTEVQACIFCDGRHHDDEETKRSDAGKRKCLENKGYEVIVWHYLDNLQTVVEAYPHIFTKVKS